MAETVSPRKEKRRRSRGEAPAIPPVEKLDKGKGRAVEPPLPPPSPAAPPAHEKPKNRRAGRRRDARTAAAVQSTPGKGESSKRHAQRAAEALLPEEEKAALRAERKRRKAEKKLEKAERRDKASKKGEGQEAGPALPEAKWAAVPIANTDVSKVPPIWSADRRFFFTVSDRTISVHSSTFPEYALLSTIGAAHSSGHTDTITALHLSPSNPLQLVSASLDGTVRIWDWVEGRLVRTIRVDMRNARLEQMCVGEVAGKWWIFAACSYHKDSKKKKKAGSGARSSNAIVRIPLAKPNPSAPSYYSLGRPTGNPSALFISPRSTYLVCLAGNKAYTYRLPSAEPATDGDWPQLTCVKFVSDANFTCGVFSPQQTQSGGGKDAEEWFATGDTRGIIRLWHGLTDAFRQVERAQSAQHGDEVDMEAERRLPTTQLHWHAHAVGALAFTESGAQLLSVGEESVLVQWHLASGTREYVPRLGGRPIISLGVKPGQRGQQEEWWMGLSDGGRVKVGANSGKIVTVGQTVRFDPLRRSDPSTPYPLALHPSTSAVVLPSSHPSTLQFVDPHAPSVLFDMEVAPSNRLSRRDEREPRPVAVEKVAFSGLDNGQSKWMATMEGRSGDEREGGGLVRLLKIWKMEGGKYAVNTQLPRPHDTASLTALAFAPMPPRSAGNVNIPILLTAATDGTVKLWQARASKRPDQGKSKKSLPAQYFWSSRSSFAYRNLPVYSAAFSPDATLIALAHGQVVTLWDAETNGLLKVFESDSLPDLRDLAFVGSEGRHLAACGSEKGVIVWDLLSCEPSWTLLDRPAGHLIPLPSPSADFVVASSDKKATRIIVHSPQNSTPIRDINLATPLSDLCLLPTSQSPSPLHFIGIQPSGEVCKFGDKINKVVPKARGVSQAQRSKASTTIWQEMFGKDAFLDSFATASEDSPRPTVTAGALQSRARASGKASDVFEGSSHTLPPMGLMCDAFFEELLRGEPVKQDEARKRGEAEVLYDAPGGAGDAGGDTALLSLQRDEGVRAVSDKEVKDLASFFKDVLGLGQISKDVIKSQANGNGNGIHHASKHTNGRAVASDDDEVMDEVNELASPVKPTVKGLLNGNARAAQGDESEDEANGVKGTPGTGEAKNRGRKRKAPKQD